MRNTELKLSNGLIVPHWALTEVFKLSGGPGGQNVNKNATAVQLRLHIAGAGVFSLYQQRRILKFAGSHATKEGEILIEARQHRRQEHNRIEARKRLIVILENALKPPPPYRKKTKPTYSSIQRRLKAKAQRSETKQQRRSPKDNDT